MDGHARASVVCSCARRSGCPRGPRWLNPLQLESELGKLETAFGTGSRISSGEVRLLVPQTRERHFDLSDAILKRDLRLALETLQQLIHQGEHGIPILLAAWCPPCAIFFSSRISS